MVLKLWFLDPWGFPEMFSGFCKVNTIVRLRQLGFFTPLNFAIFGTTADIIAQI